MPGDFQQGSADDDVGLVGGGEGREGDSEPADLHRWLRRFTWTVSCLSEVIENGTVLRNFHAQLSVCSPSLHALFPGVGHNVIYSSTDESQADAVQLVLEDGGYFYSGCQRVEKI